MVGAFLYYYVRSFESERLDTILPIGTQIYYIIQQMNIYSTETFSFKLKYMQMIYEMKNILFNPTLLRFQPTIFMFLNGEGDRAFSFTKALFFFFFAYIYSRTVEKLEKLFTAPL